jgi:hypothetical protein
MSSKYGWMIHQDFLYDDDDMENENDAATIGPRNVDLQIQRRLESGDGEKFRMLDDDRILYYEGRIIGDYSGFEPLDDFGMPNAGCTTIQYRGKNGAWSDL